MSTPDEQDAQAKSDEAADIVAAIRNVFEHYFDTFDTDGNPLLSEFTKTYFGVYDAYDVNRRFPVAKLVDPGDPKSPTKPFVYRLNYDPTPVAWTANKDGDANVDTAWKPSTKRRVVHLWNSRLLIDPVNDDLTEMRAAGFPYADHIAAQSSNARQIYNQNLDKIVDRPATITNDEDGAKFIKALALQGTYDSDGDYFSKWKAGKQNTAPLAAAVTERYLKASFREVQLYEDCFYVLRQNELFTEIHLLYLDEKSHGLHRIQYYGQKNARWELTTYKKKQTLHDNFIFLYAVHGKKKTWVGNVPHPSQWTGSYDVDNPKGHSARRRMIDVRAVVEASIADETSANELELKDEFEWFVEYVKALFPSRLAVFRISEYEMGGVWKAPRDEIAAIRAHVYDQILHSSNPDKDLGGPIIEAVKKQLTILMKDEDVLVLPQGLKTGEHTRLVGGDSEFMYERDLRTGSVYLVASGTYLHQLYLGELYSDVYEATRAMLPFIQVVVWGGLIVMGGAVMGITPAAIRAWVVRQVESKITSEMVRKMVWKFFRPAIMALVVELLAYLFKLAAETLPPSTLTDFEGKKIEPNKMPHYAGMVASLAKGFFKGYLINTITDHLYKHLVVDTLEKGVENIREVKMYLLTKRAYAAIDKVRDLIHTIEGQLDGPTMHTATLLLQETTSRLARAAAGVFAVLYHLPYSEAKDVLETFGMDPSGKPPSEEQWDAESQIQLKKVIGTFESLTDLSSVDQALEKLQNGKLLPVIGTLMVLESEIIWVAETTVHHLPKKWKSLVLVALGVIVVVGAVVADEETDGAVHKVVAEVGGDFFHLPDNEEDAEKVGELVGNVFGAFFFNSVMFDKGGLFHEFREKHSILGGALWGNIKASPIEAVISLLLKRYVLLYDRVKKDLHGMTREAGENAFVDAMHAVEDKALDDQGYGHLKSFRTEDENQVSLQNIGLTIFRIRHVVKSDLGDWIVKRYGNDIAKYKADLLELNKLGTAATKINAAEVLETNVPHVYHLMAQQLTQTLDEIIETLKAIFQPFSKSDLSWVTFLKALGVAVGDVKKIQKELMDAAKAELDGLRQLTKAK